jgi:hypothetical protein
MTWSDVLWAVGGMIVGAVLFWAWMWWLVTKWFR